MQGLVLDFKYALRALGRRRLFTTAVLLTLALGIGANVAIFSLVNALLLRPLPFPRPGELVAVWETVERATRERRVFSYPDFRDLARETRAFAGVAAYTDSGLTLRVGDQAERLQGELVSPEYFRVLGVQPVHGRSFVETEAARAEVLLGHDLWQRLGGRLELLGTALVVDDQTFTVAGILPPGFRGLSGGELWLPLATLPPEVLEERGDRWLSVVGRLAPGIRLEQAGDELSRLFARLAADYPESNAFYGAAAGALDAEIFGDLRRPLWLLLGAVGLVLLIACANVANLLLIRAAGREQEAALRTALGASRGRQLRLAVLEALLLGALGGGAALLVAGWALELLQAFNPVELPYFVTFDLDLRVLVFAFGVTLLTVLSLALVEGFQGSATSPVERLREGGRQNLAARSSGRLRRGLVIAEVALALVLAIGASLLDRSLRQLQRIEAGFEPRETLAFRLDLPPLKYAGESARVVADELVAALGELPGVEAVALASRTPLERSSSATVISGEGWVGEAGAPYGGGVRVYRHEVGPAYFATLGIPLREGRVFAGREGAPVVVVSEALAQRAWPGEEALGKRLKFGRPNAPEDWFEVVGVVADVRQRTLAPQPTANDPDLYLPLAWQDRTNVAVALRSSLPPMATMAAVRQEIERHDPGIALYAVATLTERVAAEAAQPRFSALLVGLFAALAMILAAVGIYSVLAYLVLERRREIGIRMALGADRGAVLRLVVGEGMLLVAIGAIAGLVLAVAFGRVLAAHLYQVSVTDPRAFATMTVVLVAVALAACCLPARQASRLDPIRSIRGE